MSALTKFAALKVSDTPFRLMIVHPVTGVAMRATRKNDKGEEETVEAYIDVYSLNSSRAEEYKRSLFDSQQRLAARNPKAGQLRTYDEVNERGADLLAHLTAGWLLIDPEGNVIDDFPCTRENARELYTTAQLQWLKNQVDGAVSDDANFFRGGQQTA